MRKPLTESEDDMPIKVDQARRMGDASHGKDSHGVKPPFRSLHKDIAPVIFISDMYH